MQEHFIAAECRGLANACMVDKQLDSQVADQPL